MFLRITILLAAVIGISVLIFWIALDDKTEAKKARLIIENKAGETVSNLVASLVGEPCRIDALANGEQAECIFTDLKHSSYAFSFERKNGEKIEKTNLGDVTNGMFWDDKITLGEGGEVKMSRGLPRTGGLNISSE